MNGFEAIIGYEKEKNELLVLQISFPFHQQSAPRLARGALCSRELRVQLKPLGMTGDAVIPAIPAFRYSRRFAVLPRPKTSLV